MKITLYAATLLLGLGVFFGCSGSGGGSQAKTTAKATVAGKVADGYLANAVVFLDKNSNYQLDDGEPNTVTDSAGAFTLTIDPADSGKYPIVVLAIKDQTVDLDTNTAVTSTYVLSMHAVSVTPGSDGAVAGTVTNFISPISTLIRETLEANAGMTLAEAIAKVRNQLNLPADVPIQGDYVFGSYSGSRKNECQMLHNTAQEMASLMGDQASLVMSGNATQVGRYKEMIGQIGSQLPQIADNVAQGGGTDSTLMDTIRGKLHDSVAGVSPTAGFRNISSLFNNYTSHKCFWNLSGVTPRPRPPIRH